MPLGKIESARCFCEYAKQERSKFQEPGELVESVSSKPEGKQLENLTKGPLPKLSKTSGIRPPQNVDNSSNENGNAHYARKQKDDVRIISLADSIFDLGKQLGLKNAKRCNFTA